MILFRLSEGVEVSLDSAEPNKYAPIQFAGDESAVRRVRDRLLTQYGAFGHALEETTTPIDLDAAMKSEGMAEFSPQIVEGAEMVQVYDPGIPEVAVT